MLVLQFRGRGVETEDEVREIEDALVELLADGEALDGHEVMAAAHATSAWRPPTRKATFARIAPFLERARLLDQVIAATRRSLADDRYTVLWPRGMPGELVPDPSERAPRAGVRAVPTLAAGA